MVKNGFAMSSGARNSAQVVLSWGQVFVDRPAGRIMARFIVWSLPGVALIIGFTVAGLAKQSRNFDFSQYKRIDTDDYIRAEALSRDSRDRESTVVRRS